MNEPEPIQNTAITDGWTHSQGYARALQSPEQVGDILDLLDLARAREFADIGCGNGAISVSAAVRHPLCQVFAYDPLKMAVAECRRRSTEAGVGNLIAEVASADRIPLGDGAVDRVLSRNVLHHLSDAHQSFAEVSRILRSDGIFVMESPYNSGPESVGEALTQIFQLIDNSHTRSYHTEAAIRQGLTQHGMEILTVSSWTLPSRTTAGSTPIVADTQVSEWLRLHTSDDGVTTYELPVLRLVAKRSC